MRVLRIAVALLAVWAFALTLLTVRLWRTASRSQESVGTLLNVLEIRSWELPMPKDQYMEWSFELRDYREAREIKQGSDDWMDPSRKAKVVFMPTGVESVHRFWLVQTKGTSSGSTRLDVCDKPDEVQRRCDAGQLEYVWYPSPERVEDGRTYIIGEINETFAPQRRKQVVLHLVHFRQEEVTKPVGTDNQQPEVVSEGDVSFPLKGFVGYTNTGTPVKNMKVECFVGESKVPIAVTSTDVSGNFSFPELKEGQYRLKASKKGCFPIETVVRTRRTSNNSLSLVTEAE